MPPRARTTTPPAEDTPTEEEVPVVLSGFNEVIDGTEYRFEPRDIYDGPHREKHLTRVPPRLVMHTRPTTPTEPTAADTEEN